MRVKNLSKVALDSAAAGIEPAISSCKSNALTTIRQRATQYNYPFVCFGVWRSAVRLVTVLLRVHLTAL